MARHALRVMMVAAEMAPWAKVGGLGDVMGGLPAALNTVGVDVTAVIPLYAPIRKGLGTPTPLRDGAYRDRIGGRTYEVTLRRALHPSGIPVVLVDAPGLLDREVYGATGGAAPYADQLDRWAVLCRAAFFAAGCLGGPWHVLHAHDAHAALALAYHGYAAIPCPLTRAATALSIHNIGYPGIFPLARTDDLGLPSADTCPGGPLEYWGELNLLKAGIVHADGIHTVSPTYAHEIVNDSNLGLGLSGLLRQREGDLVGILNGIDTDVWDPRTDPAIPARYRPDGLEGKALCKTALLQELGLEIDPAAALVGAVARLTWQKGMDLLLEAMPSAVDDGAQFALLGTGEPGLEQLCHSVEQRFPGRVATVTTFDDALAHRIMAAADMIVVPSRYEPCGLTQMMGMRYGTVPVVRRTGGLADTVNDVDQDRRAGNGFVFEEPSARALLGALRRAVSARTDPRRWRALQRRCMRTDVSWSAAAGAYRQWYETLLERGRWSASPAEDGQAAPRTGGIR